MRRNDEWYVILQPQCPSHSPWQRHKTTRYVSKKNFDTGFKTCFHFLFIWKHYWKRGSTKGGENVVAECNTELGSMLPSGKTTLRSNWLLLPEQESLPRFPPIFTLLPGLLHSYLLFIAPRCFIQQVQLQEQCTIILLLGMWIGSMSFPKWKHFSSDLNIYDKHTHTHTYTHSHTFFSTRHASLLHSIFSRFGQQESEMWLFFLRLFYSHCILWELDI